MMISRNSRNWPKVLSEAELGAFGTSRDCQRGGWETEANGHQGALGLCVPFGVVTTASPGICVPRCHV